MALTINTNIASVSAQRHLNESRKDLDIAMERLSSGQRINSAKDDAAGLAIRDKMSSQVVGLNQSIRNANDAISLAQTAEGAMEESVSILQRMRVLAMQAINDTNTDSDRANLNDEFTQLQLELTRIGITSSFNNVKLLDGTFTGSTFQVGPGASETIFLAINDQKANAIGTTYDVASFDIFAADSPAKGDSLSLIIRGADGDGGDLTVTYTSDKAETATQTAAGMVLALNSTPTFTEKYQALTDANNSVLIRRTDGTSMGLPIRAQFDVNAAAANDTVAITVDGVATGGAAKTFTYTSGAAETAFEVATGVTAQLNADGNGFGRFYKAYASSDGKVEIRAKDDTNVDTSQITVSQTVSNIITYSAHSSTPPSETVNVTPSTQSTTYNTHASTPPSTVVVTAATTVGDGVIDTHIISTVADGTISVTTADVDSDGDLDVLSALFLGNKIVWYENNGSETFTAHTITTATIGPWSVTTGDVDGDGDLDVLSASRYTSVNDIVWYENNGSESFTPHTITTNANGAKSVTTGDVDGDGDLDVLSASDLNDKIAWYENDGSGTFTEHTISTAADGARSVTTGDVDGDGDLDVISASEFDNKIAWYENDGSGAFTEHTISTSANGAGSVTTADVDGDGDLDVLAALHGGNKIVWYENNGSETFTEHTITTAVNTPWTVATADVDGDGDLDVLSASEFDNKIVWYENNGSETFTAHTITTAGDKAISVTTADVDGDGNLDVLSSYYGDDKIAWYDLNLTPTTGVSTLDFSSLGLNAGDRITLNITGGSNVTGVIGSAGLDALLTSMASDVASQTGLFSAASSSSGVLTLSGLTDGSAMAVVTVSLEEDTITPAVTGSNALDFSGLNLNEGDRITLNIAGGTQVQGTIGSAGLDALLTSMASDVAAQTDLFSGASASSGVLTLNGLTDGSAMAAVTVSLEASTLESTTINQIINEHTGFEISVAPALNSQGALSISSVVKAVDVFVDDTDVLSASAAMQAVRVVDDAVAMIGRERAGLGAFQNRLEHAMSNMANNSQNTQAAKSVIADADYAMEAAKLAKNQILQQAGTAMLAQANSQAETVLNLLK